MTKCTSAGRRAVTLGMPASAETSASPTKGANDMDDTDYMKRAELAIEDARKQEREGFPDRAARRLAEAQVFATLAVAVSAVGGTRKENSDG